MRVVDKNSRKVEQDFSLPVFYSLPVKSRYASGVARRRFFETLKEEGTLLGTRCESCGITFVPARIYCERCFAPLKEWIDAGTKGELYSFTIVSSALNGEGTMEETVIAAVRIADSLIIHCLKGCNREEIIIGMKVEAELKPREKRSGRMDDILCFKPL